MPIFVSSPGMKNVRPPAVSEMTAPALSIIIPVLDEAATIVQCLSLLQPLRHGSVEIVVADGGSHDATPTLAQALADIVITSPRGRGIQMNHGAASAHGDILLFLHADTRLPDDAIKRINEAIRHGAEWGRFDVHIEGRISGLGLVAAMMNLRSRLTGIATGDQAIFVTREAFDQVGGFPDMPLMEDIAFSTQMRQRGRPACLRQKVCTAGRRWEKHGLLRTILLMWQLRLRYFLGADPKQLARDYGYAPRES